MANRYWVGAGTWDASNTANWSDTSGGTTGFSVPTISDAVFFNASSGNVTISGTRVAGSVDFTGYVGSVAGTATPVLAVNGSLTFNSSMGLPNGGMTFRITATGTFTCNGKNLNNNVVIQMTVATDVVTLGSAFTNNSYFLTISQGTFNTNNYTVSCFWFVSNSGSTRAINLGSSACSFNGQTPVDFGTGAGLTFDAGTSTITCGYNNTTFVGGDKTFYNVSFTNPGYGINSTGIAQVNNLTIAAVNIQQTNAFSIGRNLVVAGTLSWVTTGPTYRLLFCSNTLGTTRTVTVNALSGTDQWVDIRDITFAGAAAPITSTRWGDCGGNSGVTFPSPRTIYWNGATGGNITAGNYALTDGGATSSDNFPRPQDTLIIPAANPNTGSTITFNAAYNYGTINASARTANTLQFQFSAGATICGDWVFGSGVNNVNGTGVITFASYGTQDITSAGKYYNSAPIVFSNGPSGTTRLQDAFTTLVGITHNAGTLNLNGYSAAGYSLTMNSTYNRTIAFNGGNVAAIGVGTVVTITNHSYMTLTGSPSMYVSQSGASSRTVNPGSGPEGKVFNYFVNLGVGSVTLSSGTYGDIDFTGFTGTLPNTAITVYGSLKLATGMTLTAGTNAMTFAATSGTKQITSNGKTINRPVTFNGVGGTWVLQDAFGTGTTLTYTTTLTNGTLNLGGNTYTAGLFASTSGTRNLTFNGGTLVIAGSGATAFNVSTAGFTTTAGTANGQISMTSGSAKTFVGGGFIYAATLNQGGLGVLTITGSNRFYGMANTAIARVQFTGGTTNTFTTFDLNGTAGNLLPLGSTNTTPAILAKGTDWYVGANSTNGGNNTGLIFSNPP